MGSSWVSKFEFKPTSNGSIERYKARLIATGFTLFDFTQKGGIVTRSRSSSGQDESELYSLLPRTRIGRCFNVDVKNAFLHRDRSSKSQSTHSVVPPPGLLKPSPPYANWRKQSMDPNIQSVVWQVQHSCYSPREARLTTQCSSRRELKELQCSLVYVDDIVLTGDDPESKRYLKKKSIQLLDTTIFWTAFLGTAMQSYHISTGHVSF